MILLDDRIGSVDLAKYLPDAEVTRLECADAVVVGADLTVGVELKRVGDLLRVIQDGRFVAQQLPCLLNTYQRVFLLVEGIYKCGPSGEFLTRRGGEWWQPDWGRRDGWLYSEVQRWLFSVGEGANIRVSQTGGSKETGDWLRELDAEFQKPATERRSLQAIYQPVLEGFAPPTLVRQFAALLPGIGTRRSSLVAGHFKTARRLANSTVAELVEIKGVGKTTAEGIVKALEDEK